MIVGLPGTGIGGLFYLLSALWMPVREAWRAATGRRGVARWRAIAKLSGLSASIFGSLWLTAVALDMLFPSPPPQAGGAGRESVSSSIGVTATYVTLATLAVVLVTVEIAAAVVNRRGRRQAAEAAD